MKRALIVITGVAILALLGLYIPRLIHETVESRVPGQQYVVSLGDSVAAGAGLGNNAPGSCDLSGAAYPLLLGLQLHKPVEQFACSGAVVASQAADGGNTLGGQYGGAQPFLSGSDVTIYAGANDINWLQLLVTCTQTNCATTQTHNTISTKLNLLQKNLTNFLGHVQQAHPRGLLVNTYYDLLAPDDTCLGRLGITPQEVRFINTEETALNTAITTAATHAKAIVVHINFSGHMLCNANPWIQGVSANAPLHPTAAGQQQIAQQDFQAFAAASSL